MMKHPLEASSHVHNITYIPERRERKPGSALVLKYLMHRAGRQARQAEQAEHAEQASTHARPRARARAHACTCAPKQAQKCPNKFEHLWVRFRCPEYAQNVGTFLEAFSGSENQPKKLANFWEENPSKEKCDARADPIP